MKTSISLLIVIALSGCLSNRPYLSTVCRTVDHIQLSKEDHLSRRTKEQIAVLNENLRKMCID